MASKGAGNNKLSGGEGKKGKGKKGGVVETAQAQLHRVLAKELAHEWKGIQETNSAPLEPPKVCDWARSSPFIMYSLWHCLGLLLAHSTHVFFSRTCNMVLMIIVQGWHRVDIDNYVNRGDEGIIVVRKNFPDHRVDLVASTQLVDTLPEDMQEDDDEEGPPDDADDAEGASAAILIVVTKLGRGKPLVLECLANQESGCTITRVGVGIDPNVYISSVYGPTTPLYLTFTALWEEELNSAGIKAGENHYTEEQIDLWNAAKEELQNDPTAVHSPDFYELEPEFQEAVQDLVDSRVEPKVPLPLCPSVLVCVGMLVCVCDCVCVCEDGITFGCSPPFPRPPPINTRDTHTLHIYVRMHACMCICKNTYICVFVFVCARACVLMYTIFLTHKCAYVCACEYMYVYVGVCGV